MFSEGYINLRWVFCTGRSSPTWLLYDYPGLWTIFKEFHAASALRNLYTLHNRRHSSFPLCVPIMRKARSMSCLHGGASCPALPNRVPALQRQVLLVVYSSLVIGDFLGTENASSARLEFKLTLTIGKILARSDATDQSSIVPVKNKPQWQWKTIT